MRRRIRTPQGPDRAAPGARPRPQARPGRHPRDRVLHPDPPADRRRPRPGAAPARDPGGAGGAGRARAGSTGPTAATLAEAYVAHRELEHRLQMLEDAQTQRLPESRGRPRAARRLLRPADSDTFVPELTGRLETVNALTEHLLRAGGAAAEAPAPEAVFADPQAARGDDGGVAAAAGAAQRAGAGDLPAAASHSSCAGWPARPAPTRRCARSTPSCRGCRPGCRSSR